MVAVFWWNGVDDSKKIRWISWDKLCAPKSEGGFGFKNMYAFNLGLIAKQGWRLVHEPHYLVAQTLKTKYYPTSNFLQVMFDAMHLLFGKVFVLVGPLLKRIPVG